MVFVFINFIVHVIIVMKYISIKTAAISIVTSLKTAETHSASFYLYELEGKLVLFPNLGALPGKMSPRDVLSHHNLSHFPPSSSPDHFNQHTATVKAQEVELCQF